MADESKPVPHDFVYAGQRVLKGGKLGTAVYVLQDGLRSKTANVYTTKGARRMILGGVYRGASFSAEGQCTGLQTASYIEKWPDRDSIVEWTAKDANAEYTIKAERFRRDANKQNLIEECMAPIRKVYLELLDKGDVPGARALRVAVDLALMRKGGM